MLVLSLAQKLYELSLAVIKYTTSPPDQQRVRKNIASEAIKILHDDGGNRLHVRGAFYEASKVVPVDP